MTILKKIISSTLASFGLCAALLGASAPAEARYGSSAAIAYSP